MATKTTKNKAPKMNQPSAVDEKKTLVEESKSVTLDEALKKFDMEMHIISLLNSEPFFAAISRHVEKKPSLQIPTAGVRISGEGHYEMLYNPLFFAKYDNKKRLGVLKHETWHMLQSRYYLS